MESSFSAWWRETAPFALLTCVLVATRVAFRSRYLYDIDSVNFALGLRRFDPSSYQPHPPGYFLYICLGRIVDAFLHDANAAFVAISIAASCGALMTIYVLADNWLAGRPHFLRASFSSFRRWAGSTERLRSLMRSKRSFQD